MFLSKLVFVDLGSFQAFGIATNLKQSKLPNDSRPLLAQPISQSASPTLSSSQQKILKVEFEINPIR
ncbi:unnamed protein product [Rotaria sp. Silwood1]|nr:unnamed protein product [Rotaria sp. Silwood1]CAF1190404.1 unnamed protein product [Rotaria sp. Silwood1]CAF3481746.1 unnamed protein product [Rotaria sp. Silwood1]CAF4757310.1 unnamed protein product [Rotaria sp. Silwood1]CAF4795474.1 unnamed protein product [Rotaria sp. Silwood1]